MKMKFDEVKRPDYFEKFGFHTCFVNDRYMVDVQFGDVNLGMKGFVWLSIKRKDKNWIRDWRELQKIKNEICGSEREGCEIYPAESRLVDTSNQFHIFVLAEGENFPFGFKDRLVIEGHSGGWKKGSSQRHFKVDERPSDCKTFEDASNLSKKLMDEMKK